MGCSFRVEIFLANGIKFLLIQNAFVPKTISLCIELCLKMTGEYRLDLTGILLRIVESKELQAHTGPGTL